MKVVRILLCSAIRVVLAMPALVIVLWACGLVLSDRWRWSQWIWWIPSVAALGAGVFCFVLVLVLMLRVGRLKRRRLRLLVWGAIPSMIAVYIGCFENRMFSTARVVPESALKIVHWNVSPSQPGDRRRAADAAFQWDADLIVLTDAHLTSWQSQARRYLGEDVQTTSSFPFGFASRLPILEVRPLIAVDNVHATAVRFDASATSLGGELAVLVIDLPSELVIGRMELARRVVELLEQAGSPPWEFDIVLGDFNITRGSASLSLLTRGMHHAWSEAGRRWSATFPRSRPLFHIDHLFVNPEMLRVIDYEIADPGVGRHRAQRAAIERRE